MEDTTVERDRSGPSPELPHRAAAATCLEGEPTAGGRQHAIVLQLCIHRPGRIPAGLRERARAADMDHTVERPARAAADPKIGAVSAQIGERPIHRQHRVGVAIRADLQRVPVHAVGRVRRAAVDRQGATAQNQIRA